MKNTESNALLGSLIATISGLTINDWAAIFGILFGLATVLMHWYYKEQELKLRKIALKKELEEKKGSKNA